MTLRSLTLALSLSMLGCMPHGNLGFEDHLSLVRDRAPRWPTVRIVGIDGARVTMKRGVFGDGLDVRTPFQGEFQPTGTHPASGYPLEIDLDQEIARRYGADGAVRLRGSLLVPEHLRRHGVLRIDVTDCEVRALVSGDLDLLKVRSDELPTPEMACSTKKPEARRGCGHEHRRERRDRWRGWHEMMGWGPDDGGEAVLLLAVDHPGDHLY